MGDAELLAWINTGKNIAALLVAIGVAGEFTGDWISGPINRRLERARQDEMARLVASSDSQKKELADAVARGKEADARIAEAQRGSAEANARASKAQESLALAEQHSAEANAKAEGFRLDIAKANEGAARANETSERERLARLQLEARLADRVFTPDQQRRCTSALASSKGITVDVSVLGDTIEIATFSGSVLDCLR